MTEPILEAAEALGRAQYEAAALNRVASALKPPPAPRLVGSRIVVVQKKDIDRKRYRDLNTAEISLRNELQAKANKEAIELGPEYHFEVTEAEESAFRLGWKFEIKLYRTESA